MRNRWGSRTLLPAQATRVGNEYPVSSGSPSRRSSLSLASNWPALNPSNCCSENVLHSTNGTLLIVTVARNVAGTVSRLLATRG